MSTLRQRERAGEEGVALLLVLVILVMTIGSVYAFARTSLLDVMGMRHRLDLARARMLADSGVELGRRAVIDDAILASADPVGQMDTYDDAWAILSRTEIPVSENAELRVKVRDSGSRINLNGLVDGEGRPHAASAKFLKGLLEKIIGDLPVPPEERFYDAEELADAILDWIDTDSATRIGDDEADAYARLGATGRPANRPLFAIEELAGLPGVDALMLEALRAYFTIHPVVPSGPTGLNPNTAPPHVLAALYSPTEDRFADDDDVFRVMRMRREGTLFCAQGSAETCSRVEPEVDAIGAGGTVFPPLQYRSEVFTIVSEARVGESRATVQVVIDRTDPGDVRTLAYGVQ